MIPVCAPGYCRKIAVEITCSMLKCSKESGLRRWTGVKPVAEFIADYVAGTQIDQTDLMS
jgi:hypothetical protein